MVTNMMCFFVMLFAMMSLATGEQSSSSAQSNKGSESTSKARSSAKAVEAAFSTVVTTTRDQSASMRPVPGGKALLLVPQSIHKVEMPRIAKKVKNLLQTVPMKEKLEVTVDDQNVKIRIPSRVLFQSGQAILKPESEIVLKALMSVMSEVPNDIRIDGHSDDLPTKNSLFPSNWELSSARACAVVRFYVEQMGLDPGRFSAQSYSSYRPQVENLTEREREINRRVEIIILTAKRKKTEEFTW
jgi:chemotaxis protein MotB